MNHGRIGAWRLGLRIAAALAILGMLSEARAAARLRLACEGASPSGEIQAQVMRPVDVYLVAERDSLPAEVSTVAYTLRVPDGLLVVGEELLVQSVLGLGSSTTGMNLVFRCVSGPSSRILRFRLVATRPMQEAVIGLEPDTRTKFLGLVACQGEEFAKFDSPADSLRITAR